jgi:NADP-dependent 3-hydroxy acid dehydrogenase YdfG
LLTVAGVISPPALAAEGEYEMPGRLEGKAALITGASSGIGEATAIALANEGAAVAVSARRKDRLDGLVKQIAESGGRAIALVGDVADETAAKGFVADTVAGFGRLDILVNSAGLIQHGGVENANTAQWRRLMDVNLMGTLYTCSAAIKPMRAQGGGDIINISSISGRRATKDFNPYATSKFALNAMSEGLRQEVGGDGIRVCVIEPGATTSEVAEGITDPQVREAMRKHVTKQGAMRSEDIAAAVIFVATLPPRVNVSELLLRPTIDTLPM